MKESTLHKSGREWAYREYGQINAATKEGLLKIFKMTTLGQMGEGGWPDWLVLVKPRHTFFVELKNPDGKGECTDLQLHRHAELRALGFTVYVVNNLFALKGVFKSEIAKAQGKKTGGSRIPVTLP